ncbi:hypothetical protein DPMN_058962 [Dreissena polymorpha]|uniref:Uncharacterized protein n=1 Tax=Dreissena polymorpha TaxID=45954 RepID=A0A9D4C2P7_DREPO|nr:hypothetical protein DPMN_058962 [Dreissena polymorpha]
MALQRPTRLVMGPCIVEIDHIVIREVQYQFEVNRCRNNEIIVKGNYGWMWSMLAGRPRIYRIAIREVQYQFEENRCRNEEVIVNGNFGLVWSMWAGLPQEFQYQLEVNRFKCNFGWAWSMWVGAPGLVMGPCIVEIDRIVIRDVQYQFEINRGRNEEVNFQGSSAYSVGGDSGQDGQTVGRRR